MPVQVKVPFGTISIPPRSKELIAQALEAGRISSGRLVREFEERFAALLGAREAVALSTGTDADALALAVAYDLGARRGDEVIVPALSFVATGNAVLQAGLTPVFVDVDRRTLDIDPDRIEAAITERTCAIMPVHLMGKPAPMDAINAIAHAHDLLVVEDAAEAHGATYDGKPVGTIGHMGAFSLYVAHIITTGEGGIVVTDDPEHAEILRSLRSHGRACRCAQCTLNVGQGYCKKRFAGEGGEDIRFRFDRIGFSAKMNELEAAIGLGNLDRYEEILAVRRRNLLTLIAACVRFRPYLETITEGPGEQIGPHAFPLVVSEAATFTRTELAAYLEQHGIETRTLFASMPTQCPGFGFLGHELGEFPNAEYLGTHGIHTGVHQDLDEEALAYVIATIERFLETHQR